MCITLECVLDWNVCQVGICVVGQDYVLGWDYILAWDICISLGFVR